MSFFRDVTLLAKADYDLHLRKQGSVLIFWLSLLMISALEIKFSAGQPSPLY